MSSFVHLHTHSHYSLLNALPLIPELVSAAKDDGMGALALTDAGNMYGAIEFYEACKKAEIKPIIGVDFYVALRTRHDKEARIDNKRHRLVLLAENYEGYKNLIKLVTESNLTGFYYKPRIDRELIATHTEGLIAILPSFSSEVSDALKQENEQKARDVLMQYKEWYGAENVYLEITHHPEIAGHPLLMDRVKGRARETATPLVAAHDVYYLRPEDRIARETLMKIQGGPGGGGFTDEEEDFSFITQAQAEEYFRETPEALQNTLKIAKRCDLTIPMEWTFPNFIIESGREPDEELKVTAYEGVLWRGLSLDDPEVKTRLDYELDVIKMKGYAVYFLAVGDLLREARERGILTTIRGSVAGSLATYVLGITNVNPLEYKLPFERFLNPERPSAPDIDMDFADDRRDEIIEYARNKYGHDNVAQIGTFGTMMARACVRDVARALGHSYAIGDQIAKLIPMGSQGFPMTIDRALELVPELTQLEKKDATVREILMLGRKIEGHARHIGVHAAGVVMAPKPLTEYVPLQYDPKTVEKGEGKLITQYDMHAVGEDGVGLLKFDFLGIKNLAILADAIRRVKRERNIDIDIEQIPVDDKKTFELLARGETMGTFQLNGAGMTRYLKELKPSTIHDINAMVALYRPGPMESIPSYIERKHNPHLVNYLDPRMKEILDRSYGVITYQDDVMMIAIKLAGYSWLEADKLRKAMGKKIPEVMAAEKDKLMEGLQKNGMAKQKAEQLWQLIEPFAAYGFNKCITGDTLITDARTGESLTVAELYASKRQIDTHSIDTRGRLIIAPVTAVMENGVKQTFLVTTRSGRTIRATGNHPLYTFEGWRTIDTLAQGDRIGIARMLPEPRHPSPLPAYMASVLGYLIAEGNLCHPHGIYFYSTNDEEVEDFIKACVHLDNTKITIDRSKPATSVYVGQTNPTLGNTLMRTIRELGLAGKRATEKSIPRSLHALDNTTLATLLGKLWQGDGTISVKNAQAFYATSSRNLARDVQHLLLRFGIQSTVYTKQFKYRGTLRPGYTVCITHQENILRFATTIGRHLIGTKRAACLELAALANTHLHTNGGHPARGTKDTVPSTIGALVHEEMTKVGVSARTLSVHTGLAERLFYADTRKRGYQREVIEIIGKALHSTTLCDHATTDIFWDEIVSIEPCGKKMTYDLTVPPHHNFVANDFIVHNSHAASYGRVAYQTAYMKANYTVEYMAAILTADSGDTERVAAAIHECERLGIPVLPPDVNESDGGFTVVTTRADDVHTEGAGEKAIRFGLFTIKNFGEGIGTAIIEERSRGGKFTSLADFLERVQDRNLNKKSLESLIKAGALDNLEDRGRMFRNLDMLLQYSKEAGANAGVQDSLFGGLENSSVTTLVLPESEPVSKLERLAWERELLGLYLSGHPLDRYAGALEKHNFPIKKAHEARAGTSVVLYGIVESIKTILTKKGDTMAFLSLSDKTGTIEAVCFADIYATNRDALSGTACLGIKGRLTERGGEKSVVVEKVKVLG